jgi:hypothetical protein
MPTDTVAQIEALLGGHLPPDYREWLCNPDSPNPSPAITRVQADSSYKESVTSIYQAAEVLRYVDMENDMIAADSGDFPPGMIAIGENGSGDHVLLSLRQTDFGTIHYLFHEQSNPDEKLWGIYHLSDSFAAWLAALVPDVQESQPSSQSYQSSSAQATPPPKKPWWRF